MIIHIREKSKKRKPNAKQRELQASWEKLLKKYDVKSIKKAERKDLTISYKIPAGRDTKHIPSLVTKNDATDMKQQLKYTGTKILGIGTLHKSNAVPVFSNDEAVEISKMRRG